MGQRWSTAQRVKYRNTLEMKKSAASSKLEPPKQVQEDQQSVINISRVEEYNYRRGLISALECIIRELR